MGQKKLEECLERLKEYRNSAEIDVGPYKKVENSRKVLPKSESCLEQLKEYINSTGVDIRASINVEATGKWGVAQNH